MKSNNFKIDFFDSISLPFHILQLTSLSPFTLEPITNVVMPAKFQNILAIFLTITQFTIIILCWMFKHLLISESLPPAHKALDTFEFFLVQLNVLIIFIESFKIRHAQ